MKYDALEGRFFLNESDIKEVSKLIVSAIAEVRKAGGMPLKGYKPNDELTPLDKAQEAIFDVSQKLGIDLQSEWGVLTDVSSGRYDGRK